MLTRAIETYINAPEHGDVKYRILRRAMRLADGKPVRSRFGPLMRIQAGDLTNFFCISGPPGMDYEDVYLEVSKLRPGMAFLDVGANAGLFSMVAAHALKGSGPVLAFEPSLRSYCNLVHNAELNGIGNFYPFRAAIGDNDLLATFSEGSEKHSGKAHLDPSGSATVLQSAFSTLLPLVDAIVGDRECLIKIDVEGAEGAVVNSMLEFISRPQVRKVIVEVDDEYLRRFGSSPEAIYEAMARAGLTPTLGIGIRPHFNEIFVRK